MDFNLERFKKAQSYDYKNALCEIRNCRKCSHWMWYIFPQMRGLGRSSMADYYGFSGTEEAKVYLADSVLGSRLIEINKAVMEQSDIDAARIIGYPDVLKLRSCMTLFAAVSEEYSVFQ